MRESRSVFLVRKTHWMNSFWCLSLLPSQAANWHTFNSSVAWRAMRGAWEMVRGRTARMQREEETASRHQKSVLGDRGEYNHSSMCCCLLLMPGSDTTGPMVNPPHSHPHHNLLFGRHMQEGEDHGCSLVLHKLLSCMTHVFHCICKLELSIKGLIG